MHGCPPAEIEQMAMHILQEKKLHCYVKLNPTLLGYERVRELLDQAGFDYVAFGREQFDKDLSYDAAVPMLERLLEVGKEEGLTFGVKLTNTFQSDITRNELPGESMYMSGRALYPLALNVARKLAESFGDRLPMSYCGGATKNNIQGLLSANLFPVTVCTILLRPRGLELLQGMAELARDADLPAKRMQADGVLPKESQGVKKEVLDQLHTDWEGNRQYQKNEKQKAKALKPSDYHGPRDDDPFCRVLCRSCVVVCPNRANLVLDIPDFESVILHLDRNCNECGNCQFSCVEPCLPYRDRLTLFTFEKDFEVSENPGILPLGDDMYRYRYAGEGEATYEDLPDLLKGMVDAIRADRAYLLCK